ncbi:MAG: ABC transporter permease, partial [Cucumibacter sp.]
MFETTAPDRGPAAGRPVGAPSVIGSLLRRPPAVLGLLIIGVVVAAAIFAPLIAPFDPGMQFFEGLTLQGAPLPPNADFWLGSDLLGRDLLSRLIFGAQTSLVIGIVANGVAVFIGAVVGITAGYFRGWVGAVLMRFTDLMMSFPALLLAIVLAANFRPTLWIVAMVIAMVNWVQVARVLYTETRSLAEREFIEAERSLGASAGLILWRHILPHLVSTIVV